jgi:hypothetical protein
LERPGVIVHPAVVGPVARISGDVGLGFDLDVGFEVDVLLILVLCLGVEGSVILAGW